MSTITFSGLATGLDTESIITSLMEVEHIPIDNLESDIDYLESQNETYTSFEEILANLNSAVSTLDSTARFNSFAATTSNDDCVTATASSYTKAGTYKLEVVSLAQQQKDVSTEGFSSSSDASLSGEMTIGEVQITYTEMSLSTLADEINAADTGVTASIVNDGTTNGLRLVLTADDAATTPDIVATGSITIDTETNGHTQDGTLAHVVVDGLDIYSENNTLTDAIYGVTLNLVGVNDDDVTYIRVAADTSSIEENVSGFVSAYNEMLTFIEDVKTADSSTGGKFRPIARKMQDLLSTMVTGNESFNSLASLGFETDSETGELSYDASTLSDALINNIEDLQSLFVGSSDNPGVAKQISTYLQNQLSSSGFIDTQTASNDEKIARFEASIETMEARLEKREETLTAQFSALETLVSTLNTQADFIESFFETYNSD